MLGALGLANGGVLSPAAIARHAPYRGLPCGYWPQRGRPESGWSELPDVTPHQNMAELTRGTKKEAQ
jgi:hypothetical protein